MTDLTVGQVTYAQPEPETTPAYPEWQKVIREAQSEADAKNRARINADIDRKRKAVEDRLTNLRERLQKVGISGLEMIVNGETPEIYVGDKYTFYFTRNDNIYVQRRVEGANEELQTEVEGNYLCEVAEMIVSQAPEAYAYAIDSVDQRAKAQTEHNKHIVEQYRARQAELEAKRNAPKLRPYAIEEFNRFIDMKSWIFEQAEKGYVLKSHTVCIDDSVPLHTVIMELAEVQS